jgi:hypothetical protein
MNGSTDIIKLAVKSKFLELVIKFIYLFVYLFIYLFICGGIL